jgi:hypothetical protein
MKNHQIILLSLFTALVILGCSSKEEISPTAPQTTDITSRPEWTMSVPEEQGRLYFVGISKVKASESEARGDAMKSARKQVAEYLGSDVKSKFQEVSMSHGLSSQVVDPSILAREFQEQVSEKLVELVKDRKWYLEREFDSSGSRGYKLFVLTSLNLPEVNQQFNEMAKLKKNEAAQKAKEADDKLTKEKWETSLKMWKNFDDEDFFK